MEREEKTVVFTCEVKIHDFDFLFFNICMLGIVFVLQIRLFL